MMPADGMDLLRPYDAILLGAVGVPDHVSLWGLLIPIRRAYRQYVNLRPVRVFEGVDSPVRGAPGDVDFVVVRENVEGEYSEIGGRLDPTRTYPSMFEPAAQDVLAAMESTLREPGTRTRDLGGTADTHEVTAALVERVGG